MSISSADDHVTFDLGVRYLARDVLVGEADNHAVLGSVVLAFVLHAQSLTGIIVRDSL